MYQIKQTVGRTINSKMKSKTKELDQFYTNPNIAKKCLDTLKTVIDIKNYDIIEPSAGFGSFSGLIKNCLALDIDPKHATIKKQNFLETDISFYEEFRLKPKMCFIGNPPFGKNSSLAVKFFNHAAKFGNVIAFILPRTFRKESIHNRLHLNFHLVLDQDIEKNGFIFNDTAYDVPCCFQIWVRQPNVRQKTVIQASSYFTFTTKTKGEIAIRRVGGRSGRAFLAIKNLSKNSNYFIKFNKTVDLLKVMDLINNINFQDIVNSTAGVRSLSKKELVDKLEPLLRVNIKKIGYGK